MKETEQLIYIHIHPQTRATPRGEDRVLGLNRPGSKGAWRAPIQSTTDNSWVFWIQTLSGLSLWKDAAAAGHGSAQWFLQAVRNAELVGRSMYANCNKNDGARGKGERKEKSRNNDALLGRRCRWDISLQMYVIVEVIDLFQIIYLLIEDSHKFI